MNLLKNAGWAMLIAIGAQAALGGELPILLESKEEGWLGTFVGKKERHFDFVIKSEATSSLYVKNGGKRLSDSYKFDVSYLLIEELEMERKSNEP